LVKAANKLFTSIADGRIFMTSSHVLEQFIQVLFTVGNEFLEKWDLVNFLGLQLQRTHASFLSVQGVLQSQRSVMSNGFSTREPL
jgi:hypothetical protein